MDLFSAQGWAIQLWPRLDTERENTGFLHLMITVGLFEQTFYYLYIESYDYFNIFLLRYEHNGYGWYASVYIGGYDLEFQSFPRLENPYSSIPAFLLLVVIPSMID